MMFNPKKYLDIPYLPNGRDRLGADCWGLLCLVYREEAGIILPPWDTVDATNPAAKAVAMVDESARWLPVVVGREYPLDVLLLTENGRPSHCGVVIKSGLFLHSREGAGVCVSSYRMGDRRDQWWRRILGIHRHPDLAARSR